MELLNANVVIETTVDVDPNTQLTYTNYQKGLNILCTE